VIASGSSAGAASFSMWPLAPASIARRTSAGLSTIEGTRIRGREPARESLDHGRAAQAAHRQVDDDQLGVLVEGQTESSSADDASATTEIPGCDSRRRRDPARTTAWSSTRMVAVTVSPHVRVRAPRPSRRSPRRGQPAVHPLTPPGDSFERPGRPSVSRRERMPSRSGVPPQSREMGGRNAS
jgi:hypothetical protein